MIGLIYLVLTPALFGSRFKIGVTGIGQRRVRMRSIGRSTKGIQIPIFFAPVLYPYTVEAALHRLFAGDHAPYRVGSGHTEWFRCGLLWSNLVTALVFLVWCWVGWGLVALAIFHLAANSALATK